MQPDRQRLLQETLRRHLRRHALSHLDRLISKTRAPDLAGAVASFAERDQQLVFERLPDAARKADFIVHMLAPFGKHVLDALPPGDAAAILSAMATDDAADILQDLAPEQRDDVLRLMSSEDKAEFEELMAYPVDTAGGIMTTELVSLPAETTAEEALIALREQADDVEMAYYIYVVDADNTLVGVLSLRKLVTAPPHRRIRDLMDRDLITVTPDTDQEAVARLVSDYGILAIPVVDATNHLLGFVTVDDVIGVLEEEAQEDLLKMAGAGAPTTSNQGLWVHVRNRFPWLLASCGGGLLSAVVMGVFEDTLAAHHFFALFLPIILGMSGNVGTQSATVTVREIALGQVSDNRAFPVLRRELSIGLTLGLLYALIVGTISALMGSTPTNGIAIGFSMSVGMLLASALGTAIPLALSRFGVDPAVATGPFVTTSLDLMGVILYFSVSIPLALTFTT